MKWNESAQNREQYLYNLINTGSLIEWNETTLNQLSLLLY